MNRKKLLGKFHVTCEQHINTTYTLDAFNFIFQPHKSLTQCFSFIFFFFFVFMVFVIGCGVSRSLLPLILFIPYIIMCMQTLFPYNIKMYVCGRLKYLDVDLCIGIIHNHVPIVISYNKYIRHLYSFVLPVLPLRNTCLSFCFGLNSNI